MKTLKILPVGLMITAIPLVYLSGCTTNPYTGEQEVSKTALGAGIGSAGGAAIGAIFGGGTGAAIGAGAGAVAGGITGGIMDHQASELQRQLQDTGVQISQNRQTGDIKLIMSGDVTFAKNSADIRSPFYSTLNSVAVVLKKYNKTIIHVDGYTDNTGSVEYNQELSERRAQSVASYLANQGISSNRIADRGFGERHPIASNKTSAGRMQNRRVEITIHSI